MKNLETACRRIKKAGEIVIGCHVNPDGDTIGSMLSLGLGLKSMGKKVHMLSQDGIPKKYRSLPGAALVRRTLDRTVDVAISVDCGSKKLLGNIYKVFEKADYIVEIDHHSVREPFGNIALVDPNASCVGEIVHALLKRLGARVDRKIAENIMTSIIVETDSFRSPNIKASIFGLSMEMVKKGVDYYGLAERIFWAKTKQELVLTGLCLLRTRYEKNKQLVWSIITKEDFKKVGGKDEDVDAVADELRTLESAEVVLLFREKENGMLRVSLRSKKGVNVAKVAEGYGGGGHYDVAGCMIKNSRKNIQGLIDSVKKLL